MEIVTFEQELKFAEKTWGVRKEKVEDGSAVVLLSGGIDSSTLLYSLKNEGYRCFPVTFYYGQKHKRELESAWAICGELGLAGKVVDIRFLGELLPSALTGKGEIPEGYYTDKSMEVTVVPNRNMILLSIAAGYAEGLKVGLVAYAAHAGDHPIYPDCRPEFIESCAQTISLGTGGKVRLWAPFQYKTKKEIVELGIRLGVPYGITWSCYEGGEKHCGRCGTCRERVEAFKLAGIKDPTVYKE